jgi:hypothetical protein
MGRKTGKPGPDPRSDFEKEALRLPSSTSFGGPSRPPIDEVKRRDEKAYEDFFRWVRGEK